MYEYRIIRRELGEPAPCIVINPAGAAKYVLANCQPKEEQWKEMSWVLTMVGHTVTGHYQLSKGTVSSCGFDVKEVAKIAIESLAQSVILVHNHPSGDPRPSAADIRATELVQNGLRLFDIQLTDHVIIGNGHYYSFADEITKSI